LARIPKALLAKRIVAEGAASVVSLFAHGIELIIDLARDAAAYNNSSSFFNRKSYDDEPTKLMDLPLSANHFFVSGFESENALLSNFNKTVSHCPASKSIFSKPFNSLTGRG